MAVIFLKHDVLVSFNYWHDFISAKNVTYLDLLSGFIEKNCLIIAVVIVLHTIFAIAFFNELDFVFLLVKDSQ